MSLKVEGVQGYLAKRLQRPSLRLDKVFQIPGGASRETWSCDVSWEEEGRRCQEGLILRVDPEVSLLQSSRRSEYEVYRALASVEEIPLPETLLIENDAEILGLTFFVMRKVSGASSIDFQWDANAEQRPAIGEQWMRIGAAIASLGWKSRGLGTLFEVPTPEHTWEIELDKWESFFDAHELEVRPTMRAALRWLRRNPPPPAQRISLVHGDFRSGNYLYEDARITAMLDWEMAHLGDPIEDLGYACGGAWRTDGKADSLVGWVIDQEEAIRIWEKHSKLRVDRESLRWWTVLGMLKLNALFWSGAWEFAQGRTTNPLMPMITYMFVEKQDGWLLDAMGVAPLRPAPQEAPK